MNYLSLSAQYLITLKEKGFFDKDFHNEYDFICIEVYKSNHPEALEEINNFQAKKLLCIQELR